MWLLLFLWMCYHSESHGSDEPQKTIARQYNQMTYAPVNSIHAQFTSYSKLRCIAHCARLSTTCNIALFYTATSSRCILYSESLTVANLTSSSNSLVVDFQRNVTSATVPSSCLSSMGMNALSSYNLITLGDLQVITGIYDRTLVCGSFLFGNSGQFATQINTGTFVATDYSTEINGNFASGGSIHVYAGSLGLGNISTPVISTSDNISYTVNGRTVLLQQGSQGARVNINPNLAAKCAATAAAIQLLSSQLAGLPTTAGNNATIPTTQPGILTFFVNAMDSHGMAVFNLDANSVFANTYVQQTQIIVDSAVSSVIQFVIINLSGTGVSFSNGNFFGTWLTNSGSQTIWNFYQATSVSISRTWMGTLLAPYAAASTSVIMQGTIVVQSMAANADLCYPKLGNYTCV